jgi:amino acid transporter
MSYIFSVLIALVSLLFLALLVYLLIEPYAAEDIVVHQLGMPYFAAVLFPWILGVAGILLLGPMTLICANFFQQSKIIDLLEAQNDELILARLDRTDASLKE